MGGGGGGGGEGRERKSGGRERESETPVQCHVVNSYYECTSDNINYYGTTNYNYINCV